MIHWFDSLPSTMDTAHGLAGDGAPHGDGIAAREQQAGRGRRGHVWSAPRGGLWLSVICRPRGATANECLSVRAGLALVGVLEDQVPGIRLKLKWPNDILLRGRKVAGVLCEARWIGSTPAWIIVGVGLNITNPLPESLADEAIGLASVTPHPPDAERLAPGVTSAIAAAGAVTGPLSPQEIEAFDARDALRGRQLREPISGTAAGISDSGALVVVDEHGTAQHVVGGGVVAVP